MDVTKEEMLALNKINEVTKEIDELKKENYSLKKTLEEYGETKYSPINEIEFICLKGIEELKKLVMLGQITDKDAKTLDILYKNLRIARGKLDTKDKNNKRHSPEQLIRLIDGNS